MSRLGPFLLALCLATGPAQGVATRPAAEDAFMGHVLKATFFIKICAFVDWPAETEFGDASKPFVVGILGGPPLSTDNPWADPFSRALNDSLARTTIKGRKVVLRAIDSMDGIKGCHALYLMPAARNHLRGAVKLALRLHVLTFGSVDSFAEQGVHLNFKVINDHVRFEVNEASFQDSGLRIDSKILQAALRVHRREAK